MLRILENLEQGSPEWFAARRGMVTASVVGSLLSVRKPGAIEYDCPSCDADKGEQCVSLSKGKPPTPIKTLHGERVTKAANTDAPLIAEPADGKDAYSLTALLTAERISGRTHKTFTTDDMYRGHEYEPVAVDTYADHYGVKVRTVGFMVLEGDGYQIGYSPDALVGDDGLIEAKAPRPKGHLTTVLGDGVPAEYMPQLQTGLLVSARKWIDFVSVCGGLPLWVQRVYPDPAWFAAIIAAAKKYKATSDAMIATFNARTEGLPVAELLPDFDDVELKL